MLINAALAHIACLPAPASAPKMRSYLSAVRARTHVPPGMRVWGFPENIHPTHTVSRQPRPPARPVRVTSTTSATLVVCVSSTTIAGSDAIAPHGRDGLTGVRARCQTRTRGMFSPCRSRTHLHRADGFFFVCLSTMSVCVCGKCADYAVFHRTHHHHAHSQPTARQRVAPN